MQNLKYLPVYRLPCYLNGTISSQSHYVMYQCMRPTSLKYKLTSIHCSILRCYSGHSRWISAATEEKLKKNDNVPANYRIIYRAPMYNYIIATHAIIFGGSVIMCVGGLLRCVLLGIVPTDIETIAMSTGFVGMNYGMFRILRMYILRIYCDENGSYILVRAGNFPLQFSKLTLSEGNLKRLEPKGHMPWRYNIFSVHGEKTIILEHHFQKPSDLDSMLGKKSAEVTKE